MFKHLRNKLIVVNLAVTSAVLILALSAIYVVAQEAAHRRKIVASDFAPGYTQVVIQTLSEQIQAERSEALNSLFISLCIVGVTMEAAVAILSYALAEAAIRPIKDAYEAQKVFVANASHEMKTPIAAILANLEVADIHGNPWIDNVTHEVQALATLNQDLLATARAENAMSTACAPETVILKQYVEELILPFEPRLKTKGVNLTFKTKLKDGKAKLAKNDFAQIIGILMDNALKYCDKDIIVKLTSKSISISNDGAKIQKAELSKIFDRFYQTNKSSDGVGLGLAIAKTLAERHNWELTATSNKEETKFTLEW